jgi:hypothetical protein
VKPLKATARSPSPPSTSRQVHQHRGLLLLLFILIITRSWWLSVYRKLSSFFSHLADLARLSLHPFGLFFLLSKTSRLIIFTASSRTDQQIIIHIACVQKC